MNKTLSTGHTLEFNIGETVYLKTDNDQVERLITGISLRPCNAVTYCLAYGQNKSWHYGIEISYERNLIKVTTN